MNWNEENLEASVEQQKHNEAFHLFNPFLQLQNQKIQRYNKQLYNPR